MAKEIERKFLLANDSWKKDVIKTYNIIQAYISRRVDGIVRLRMIDEKAYLTIKGRTTGIERHEWEYEIPIKDAQEMMANNIFIGNYILKTRNIVEYEGRKWEIDVFNGSLKGLVLAEIELPEVEADITLPPFIGREVSGDARYFNSCLLKYFGSETE